MTNLLKEKIATGRLVTLMSAHNPLSARLAEEAGFDGIWASGFELSAAYGVPDASLLSLTQHLDMTRAIGELVAVPVVADLDTGYGNAINVLHVVRLYAAAGAAAVVIEDKMFPKDTSLLAGGRQELVRAEEFQGKIEAAKAASGGMLVIARTEALIAASTRRCGAVPPTPRPAPTGCWCIRGARPRTRSSPLPRHGPGPSRWCWYRPPIPT